MAKGEVAQAGQGLESPSVDLPISMRIRHPQLLSATAGAGSCAAFTQTSASWRLHHSLRHGRRPRHNVRFCGSLKNARYKRAALYHILVKGFGEIMCTSTKQSYILSIAQIRPWPRCKVQKSITFLFRTSGSDLEDP